MNQIDWTSLLAETTEFTQRLIQTPSMPQEEKKIAEVVADEMKHLHYDEVWIDEIGNVFGRVSGLDRDLGALVLNSHLDHVDPGDLQLWPYPPFSGETHQGRIFGRGACDIKGPLAVQIYSLAPLIRSGLRPKRDVIVSAFVEEETGGAGAQYWIDNLDYAVELIVLGEPSSNHISLGHRGIWHTWVTFTGKSVHASVPDAGINPNYAMSEFIERLRVRKAELSSHPILGGTSVAPTIVEVDTKSPNVTPAWTRVLLDFRTSSESISSLQAFIEDVGRNLDPQISSPGPSWTDVDADRLISGFYTPPDSDIVRRVYEAIEQGMGWRPELRSYQFATDGRHVAVKNDEINIIGYSAGEENLAHTVNESISVQMMLDSLKGHVQLISEF
jgi:succinyl-diaminopimelate desuccinylase